MNPINDGGPMMPTPVIAAPGTWTVTTTGETRRQALARCAMQGLCADPTIKSSSEEIAIRAFKIADAMLAHEAKEAK